MPVPSFMELFWQATYPVASTLAGRRVTGSLSVRPLQANHLPPPEFLFSLHNAVTLRQSGRVSYLVRSFFEPVWLLTEGLEEPPESPEFTSGLSEQPANRIVVPRVVASRVFVGVGDIRHVGKIRGKRFPGMPNRRGLIGNPLA
jgi:hypothetical protein